MSRSVPSIPVLAFAAALLLTPPGSLAASPSAQEEENLRKTQEIAEGKMALNGPSGDTWILAGWDWTKKKATSFGKWCWKEGKEIFCEDLAVTETKPCVLAAILGVAALCLLSGGWNASIAQMRRHPKWKFFFAGLFSFFTLPLYNLFSLDIAGERERLQRLAEAAAEKRELEAEQKRKEAMVQQERGAQEPKVSADGTVWDQSYFRSIARLADGTPDGPWNVRYNGVEVQVLQIIDPQPEFVQARIVNQEGAAMNGRIPYSRIEKWERA